MSLRKRENFLRNASFRGHEWIPQKVSFSKAAWNEMETELKDICRRHPVLFPDFDGSASGLHGKKKRSYTDDWGCRWEYAIDGLEGIVTEHPLDDWNRLESWSPPEPPEVAEEELKELEKRREQGEVVTWGTEHGFIFLRLTYLRGFANLMLDIAEDSHRLKELTDQVVGYWEKYLDQYTRVGLDCFHAADDLGTQVASFLGPKNFRSWLSPAYSRLFRPLRDMGTHVAFHTDGYIMDIADEIIATGVSILNPQDLVNGIDNLAEEVRGRVCIRIDIDRQQVLPYGSPADVRDLVKEEVMKLGSPAGGLEMIAGIYPPTPPENIEALCSALEEYRTYWVGK